MVGFLFFIYLFSLPKYELNKNDNNRGKTASLNPHQELQATEERRKEWERVIPREEHTNWLSKLNAFLQEHTHK